MCMCNFWYVFGDSSYSQLTCVLAVSPAPGKASGLEVHVQGKHVKTVTEFLLSRGVPKRWIESADLMGKK